ncbi:putative acyl-CoA thioesterase II [Streptomyces sp. Tu6071]|nr:putative acyl-CoA thioesterase II [Streptomyces sp. Tu6071]
MLCERAYVTMTDTGGPVPERLVDLLDLERIEVNIFRGRSPDESLQRVFGGQVAGQALVAAGRTVDADRPVHSLHAYFLRPGRPGVPIAYEVERVRDGRSFTTRRVTAVQQGRTIFALTASFHVPEEGAFAHQLPPAGPGPLVDPESLPRLADEVRAHLGGVPDELERMARRQPFDIRYVNRLRWTPEETAGAEPRSAVWMRAVTPLGDDPLVHTCALAYVSDTTLLDAVRLPVEPLWGERLLDLASLDHAMWFHRPFRADEWLLYEQESPVATGGLGLARGRIYDRAGRLLVSVVQEGLFRSRGGIQVLSGEAPPHE